MAPRATKTKKVKKAKGDVKPSYSGYLRSVKCQGARKTYKALLKEASAGVPNPFYGTYRKEDVEWVVVTGKKGKKSKKAKARKLSKEVVEG